MKSVRHTAAKVAHDVWSHWMKYMFTQTTSVHDDIGKNDLKYYLRKIQGH